MGFVGRGLGPKKGGTSWRQLIDGDGDGDDTSNLLEISTDELIIAEQSEAVPPRIVEQQQQ